MKPSTKKIIEVFAGIITIIIVMTPPLIIWAAAIILSKIGFDFIIVVKILTAFLRLHF